MQRDLACAYVDLFSGRGVRAVSTLEAARQRANSGVITFRLAETHCRMRNSVDAVLLLRHSLEDLDDPLFWYGLADAYARLGMWQQSVQAWDRLPPRCRKSSGRWMTIRLAKALRIEGRPLESLTLIELWLAGSQPCSLVIEERRRAEAGAVDWRKALRPVGRQAASRDPLLVLRSEFPTRSIGYLAGSVAVDESLEPRVSLRVNGREVVTTQAHRRGHLLEFEVNVAELQEYLGDGDTLQLEIGDRAVALSETGPILAVDCGLPSRFQELVQRLDGHQTFTKFGQLCAISGPDEKYRILNLYEQVAAVIQSQSGSVCYPIYGNLLGAIRENDFIQHDVGGFDALCLCAGTDPVSVKNDFVSACRRLIEAGFELKLEPWGAFVRRPGVADEFIDVCYGWFEDDRLRLSFGWRFEPAGPAAELVAPRSVRLFDRSVGVPYLSEAVLEQLYGPEWRTPDQGFRLEDGLRRDDKFLLNRDEAFALRAQAPESVELRGNFLD